MPVVRAKREVSTAALPGVRKSAAETPLSEGAGRQPYVEEALGKIGDAVGQQGAALYAREMQKERALADQTALLEVSNRISDWKNKRLYDSAAGAFALKGKAALPLPEDIRAEFGTLTGDLGKTMVTAEQKLAFGKLVSQEWDSIDLQVRRHVFGEMQTYRATEVEGAVKNGVSEAQAAYLDPTLVNVALTKATSTIETMGPSLGWGEQQIKDKVRETQSATHVGVIYNLLAAEKDQQAADRL